LSTFDVPSFLVDPYALPAPLMTSEPGSFAHNTFSVRIPRIIDDIIASNAFPSHVRSAMQALRNEIVSGRIRPLLEEAPDTAFWNQISQPWHGRTWLDVPWYWAETYFYRRVLEATGYFQPGEWHGIDPYTLQKQSELKPDAAPRALRAALGALPHDPALRFEALLHASLWGNRTDLSYNVATTIGPTRHVADERANMLVDDSVRVWQQLASPTRRRVAIINDNAGTELLMDLALADFLLDQGITNEIALHLKPQPFFVSDAMPKDVRASIEALSSSDGLLQTLGQRLQQHVATGRMTLSSHWYYSTCLFYFQMPADLVNILTAFDLVILKGDANYRRLLGDAHWPPTSSFATATAYFPAPLVSLRTLKAELIVGLGPGVAEQLSAQESDWRVNGRRGVVQANLETQPLMR
jgi:hypothetical protein